MGTGRPEAPSLEAMTRLTSGMGDPQLSAPVIHLLFEPQQRAHPRQQFVQRERLDEVIVRPPPQPADAVLDGVLCGQDQHVGVAPRVAQPAQKA